MKHSVHVYSHYWLWTFFFLLISEYSFGQTYCTPTYNFVDCNTLQRRVYVTNVTLNNRTFSSGCSQAGYAGVVNRTSGGVEDPVVLTTAATYTMSVNTYEYDSRTYAGISNQAHYAVWIDYNSNGTFDADERIKADNSTTFSFTLRNNVAGNYRMRIRTQTTAPCAIMDYGEAEDYLLKIIPPQLFISNEQSTYCITASYTLSAFGCDGGTIRWFSNGTFLGNNPANVPLLTGYNNNYASVFYATCTINRIDGPATPKSIPIWVVAPPAISSDNYNLTVGQTTTLTAIGCSGIVNNCYWSNGARGVQITVAPSQTTRYTAICNSGGRGSQIGPCSSKNSNEITITVNAPSAPSVSASRSIVCPNESVTLSAGNCAGTIKWSTGISGPASISVSPSQQTEYWASCVINGVESARATTTISVNPTTTIVTQPTQAAVCEGNQANFSVTAAGSGTLSYLWTRNGQPLSDTTAQLIVGNVTTANNGNYQVKVTGGCGSVLSNAVSLQVSPTLRASTSTISAICSGDANGSISVMTTGGLTDKAYRLGNQGDYQSSSTFSNLRAGTYTVQVRDQAGCTTDAQAEVKQPDRITFTVKAPVNAKCAGGSDGAVDVQAAGGNGGFTYSINGGANQPSGLFQNLRANAEYILKATDAKGCSETTSAYVGAPNQIIVSSTPVSVLCAGGNTGKISVTASGGNGSYQYQLGQNQQQINSTFGDLKAGTYTITVKDDNGCEGKADVTVTQPTPVNVSATSTLVSCVSDTSAFVNSSATGGISPYMYQIGTRTFQTGNTFGGVREGSFPITVKDANGCTASTTIIVKKAEPLLLQATTQAASCCTCPDGSVSLTNSGGIGQKQYQFGQLAFQTSSEIKNLVSGRYPVVVRDEAGCPTSLTVTITNATAATLTFTNVKNVTCAGGRDGSATVQVSGGNQPYSYAWQTKNSSDSLGTRATVVRLPEGEFTVTVTDNNRCSSVSSGTLSAQNPLPPKPTITQSGGNLVSSAQSGVQWYSGIDPKAGMPVTNATQATFTPFQSNPYFVVSTVNSCVSPPSDIFTFVLTALEPIMPLAMRVVPNPISERLRVEIDQPDKITVHLQLIDLTGKIVLDVQTPAFVGKKQFEWAIPQADAGVHLLRAEAGLRKAASRVVIH